MPTLSDSEMDEVWRSIMRHYSSLRKTVPFKASDLRTILVDIDNEINSAETSIFQGIVDPDVKAWLQNNQPIARGLIEQVAAKRQEVL